MAVKFRSILVAVAAVAVSAVAVSGAGANKLPTVTSSYTQGKTDIVVVGGYKKILTTGETGDALLAAHADYNVDLGFFYGATEFTASGRELPDSYPDGTDFRETVKDIVVESPPGLIGNPNAIPFEERCDPTIFETGECPDSSTVGEIWLQYSLMSGTNEDSSALNIIPLGPTTRTGYNSPSSGWTRVSLLKTDPEVPARIGVYVKGPVGIGEVRTRLDINPVTSEDLRLRTVTMDAIPQQVWNTNTDEWEDFRLERMRIKLFGKLANGHNFMTNSSSCQAWPTKAWTTAHFGTSNWDSNPFGGTPAYVSAGTSIVDPDCSNAAAVPFPINGTVGIDTPARDYAPAFDFTITNPGIQGDGQASTSPKRIVTTIPASINVDVQQLGRTCTIGDFNADTCATSARVGSVKIETPLLRAGLTGDVYLVKKNATSGLPDLGLRIRGAITFTQLGSNRYVGAKNNQIETTFNDIPQVGFSKLTFHLDGGPQGLLRSLSCPTYNKAPALPNFTYNFFAYTGAQKSVTTPMNLANCFGIQTLKKYPKCLRKKLPIHPNYQSRTRVKSVSAKIDGKQKASTKKIPFRFDLKIKKLKLKQRKTHTLELKAIYDDGTVSKKKVNFKVCK
ncbi:MAG: hypothetical protein ACRDKE_02535 [Solirubrobacterales bacterium]